MSPSVPSLFRLPPLSATKRCKPTITEIPAQRYNRRYRGHTKSPSSTLTGSCRLRRLSFESKCLSTVEVGHIPGTLHRDLLRSDEKRRDLIGRSDRMLGAFAGVREMLAQDPAYRPARLSRHRGLTGAAENICCRQAAARLPASELSGPRQSGNEDKGLCLACTGLSS